MTDLRSIIGIHADITPEAYHALPGASASRLMKLWGSTPAHLRLQLDEPWEPTAAMVIGTVGHSLVLEPGKPLPKLLTYPANYTDEKGETKEWTLRAKVCKQWVSDRRAQGFIVCSEKDYANAVGAAKALSAHPFISSVLADSATELTLITWDSTNEVGARCRFDIKPGSQFDFLADCKFTASVDEHWFSKHAYDMGYHIQAAFNLMVWNQCGDQTKNGFKFFAVENKPPFDCRVFNCSDDFLAKGREEVRKLLRLYGECERTNVWPGSPATEAECKLPGWVRD